MYMEKGDMHCKLRFGKDHLSLLMDDEKNTSSESRYEIRAEFFK